MTELNIKPHILLINLPMQSQLQIQCASFADAELLVKTGLKGLIECKQGTRKIVVHTVPGAIYAIVSQEELERSVRQHQILQPGNVQGH